MFGFAKKKKKETPQEKIVRLFKKFYTDKNNSKRTIIKLAEILKELLKSNNEKEWKNRLFALKTVNNVANLDLGFMRNSLLILKDLIVYMNAKEKQIYERAVEAAKKLGEQRKKILDELREAERRN